MLDQLLHLVARLGHWGYLVIFLGALLESATFLGLVVPGETLVLLGGFLAAQGILDYGDLMALVAIAAIIGDSIGYELGRHFGRAWLLRHGKWAGLRERHFDRVQGFFGRHGGKTVFIGRFMGFLRALTPFVAGSSRMYYPRFLLYNVAGAVLWSVAFVLLGYFLGASWQVAAKWLGPAGAILGGLIVAGLMLGWLWRLAVRHEKELKERWSRLVHSPRMVAFRRKYAPVISFLQARLSPTGYLGLRLTAGVLIILAAGWTFGGIVEDVLSGDPLTVVDRQVASWLHAHASEGMTQAMQAVTVLGSWKVVTSISAALIVLLAVRKSWYEIVELILAVPGGAILNGLLKHLIKRPRPMFAHAVPTVTGYSFPSGHANAATVLYGFLCFLAVVYVLQRWKWRALAVLGTVFLVLLVDFSRLYLGVHYLSDVLAANTSGLAWLAIVLTAVPAWRHSRTERRRPTPA